MKRRCLELGIILGLSCGSIAQDRPPAVPPDVLRTAKKITAGALRKHVAYLASDKLQGRANGTPGLDDAGSYIASEFASAGLEPGGTDKFFQPTDNALIATNFDGYHMTIRGAGPDISVAPEETLLFSGHAMDFNEVPMIKIDSENGASLAVLKPEDVRGKCAMIHIITKGDSMEGWKNMVRVLGEVDKMRPALVITYGPRAAKSGMVGQFKNPETAMKSQPDHEQPDQDQPSPAGVLHFPVRTAAFLKIADKLKPGPTPLRFTLHLPAPLTLKGKIRNVAGLLPGSGTDGTYVVVTAYYDGSFVKRGDPDPILNSANANASGVAVLIETARALASLKTRPLSSILFLALSGEGIGSLGAKYYVRQPLVPLAKTIGCINLVNMGRTDSIDGIMKLSAAITGAKLSILPQYFGAAGQATGITVYDDHKRDTVNAGSRGFRPMLLDSGVPSHSLYVAFDFPDSNKASDEAKKLDYENMARVNQMVAAGLFLSANDKPLGRR